MRNSKQLPTTIIEQLPVGIALIDAEGRIVLGNARMQHLAADLLPSRDPRRVNRWQTLDADGQPLPPDQWPGERALRGETVSAGMEFVYTDDEGRRQWLLVSATPYRGTETEITGAIWSVQDITGLKQAELGLRLSEERFSKAFHSNPAAIALITVPDGILVDVNATWLTMFEYEREEAVGNATTDLRIWPDLARRQLMLERFTRMQSIRVQPEVLRRKSGTEFPALVSIDPIELSGNQVAVVTFEDVSERQRAEEALRDANERLLDADRRKDEFLAILAHELRNPLAPIRTWLDLLKQPAREPGLLERALPVMDRQVSHLVRLVDDLLDVSRISLGKVELQRAPLDLNRPVEAAIEQVRPLLEAHGHELRAELSPHPLPVLGDFERLTQVVTNLLSNAVKFTEPSGTVTVVTEQSAGGAAVSVRDTGIGIEPESLSEVFNLFHQVDGADHQAKGRGLGIGLALSRQLVELHGGTIDARSSGAGRGSTFAVRLPIHRLEPEAPGAGDGYGRAEQPVTRILVVDDNVDAADGLRMLLKLDGHSVEAAYGGGMALKALERFEPDVVLLDLGLPDMDGVEVARRIRAGARGAAIRLIALTGWGQPADLARTRAAGFDDHLTKPVNTDMLRDVLKR